MSKYQVFLSVFCVSLFLFGLSCNLGPGPDFEDSEEQNQAEQDQGGSIYKPPECHDVCGPSADCDRVCWDGTTTTCGDSEFGCYIPPDCIPNWVEVNRKDIGIFSYHYIVWCNYYRATEITYYDKKECNPNKLYYTRCIEKKDGVDAGVFPTCCGTKLFAASFCWGKRC